ncbi:MAG: hypothetical protein LC130_06000 [Bryobacterales bacterium]|nr:hypothetical protein [Bryobacterales bacterium]MEB2362028.1 hypothetical protein [Bryobacterales bacterium]
MPLALELYEQYLKGKTPRRLALQTGIPLDRLEQRLRAAAAYWKDHQGAA